MRVTGNHQDSSAVFAVNLRPRSIIASPPGPVHDHLGQRHRLELRCCRRGALGLRHRRPHAHISEERGISSRLRRDPGSRSATTRPASAEQTSARSSRRPLHWFSMWLLPRRPSKVVVLCVSCLRLSACAHVARVLWECAVACRRREVKSAMAAPAREENTESPEPLAMANCNSIVGQSAV